MRKARGIVNGRAVPAGGHERDRRKQTAIAREIDG